VAKIKRTKAQTTIYKTLDYQHKHHYIRPEYKEHVSPVLTTVFVIESAFNYDVAFFVVLVIMFFFPH
jgi:hypothetical protein